jgi:hypothetical protein
VGRKKKESIAMEHLEIDKDQYSYFSPFPPEDGDSSSLRNIVGSY